MFYGWDLLGDEVSFSGKLYSWMHIGQNQAYDYRTNMYRLVIASQKGRLLGVYLPDYESQVFANLVETSKEPLMYKGLDASTETSRDPEYDATENGHLTYNGRRYTINPVDMGLRADEEIYITSVYIKFKIINFTTAGNGALIRFYSDKNLVLRVGATGNFQFFGSGGIFKNYQNPIVEGVWYHVVVSLARVDLQPRTLNSYMMIEIFNDGNLANGKSDFNCKGFFYFKGMDFTIMEDLTKLGNSLLEKQIIMLT